MRDPEAPSEPGHRVGGRDIAKRVRDAITRSALTQTEVAQRLGWPQQRLSRRLTAADYAAPFSAWELAEVATVLNVPVAQFYEAQPAGGAR
jgi:transcriptional regulator with XRE-family HTH domain